MLVLTVLLSSAFALGCAEDPAPPAVYVSAAPPPEQYEYAGAAPSDTHVWVSGHWHWNGAAYVWMPGHWMARPSVHAAWVPGHWRRVPRGWAWVPGHWR